MVQDTCDFHSSSVLGSAGGTVLSLWFAEENAAGEDVWIVLASGKKQKNTVGPRI